jgi:hypothetical protein
MSLTVMMTSVVSDLARQTQRVAQVRGQIHRANINRIDKVQKTQKSIKMAMGESLEPYVPSGDPYEAGASIWDVLQTIRHANSHNSKFDP